MKNKKQKYDCIVIGGGPAGMMAAIRAGEMGARVLLLEKNDSLGKKLLLTGDGRCNISHIEKSNKEFVSKYGKYGDFLMSSFSIFGPKDTINYFKKNKLNLVIQEDGRVFPESNKAKDVLLKLVELLKKNSVDIVFNAQVTELVLEGNQIIKVTLFDNQEFEASSFILSTGGKSFKITGSDGQGFQLAKRIGHSISDLYPGLSPVKLNDEWVGGLSGVSIKTAAVYFFQSNKCISKGVGDIIFTHFGISGPVILDLSNNLGEYFENGAVDGYIDIFPSKNLEELSKEINGLIDSNGNRAIKNILSPIVGEKICLHILDMCNIDAGKKGGLIKKEERRKIVTNIKKIDIHPYSLLDFDRSMVTKGGVLLKDIDPKTMRSKIISNLFFSGEIIDLTGNCGGYNLQLCWTTGYLAGSSISNVGGIHA